MIRSGSSRRRCGVVAVRIALCLVIVKSGHRSGDIRLKVSSAGLTTSQITNRSTVP